MTMIPHEKHAEAAAIIEKWLRDINEALLELPSEFTATRAFAVFIASQFSVERGLDIVDYELARETYKAITQLEERMIALEKRAAE